MAWVDVWREHSRLTDLRSNLRGLSSNSSNVASKCNVNEQYLRNLGKYLRAYGLLGTFNPVSGKILLDETTKLEYHAEGVLHGYWTSGGGLVGGALRHGIWPLRCVLENGVHTHTHIEERIFLLATCKRSFDCLFGLGALRKIKFVVQFRIVKAQVPSSGEKTGPHTKMIPTPEKWTGFAMVKILVNSPNENDIDSSSEKCGASSGVDIVI
ncbi:hypothetical protein TNCV_2304801 [Trichonephila clavipes]|nr:hypothetical protein TNCV_2304801 [Trichonephila clavipes]